MTDGALPSSFRDPDGFLFAREGTLYRQINAGARQDYDRLMTSGLYQTLVQDGSLIPHDEVDVPLERPDPSAIVIRPERVPFVSYPYEWCFSQLQDAALLTLSVQRRAVEHGLSLKDASAYNVQFRRGAPVFIDTGSFEAYVEGEPWVAYRQFCQHFLAPLALMSHTDIRLSQLLKVHIDGVPLDLASRLLPFGTRFRPGLAAHLHLHAKLQTKHGGDATAAAKPAARRRLSRQAMLGIVDNLESVTRKLRYQPAGTEWAAYYDATNYSEGALGHKAECVTEFARTLEPATVWDLGANTGHFSRLAAATGAITMAFDIDPAAVEKNYRECRASEEDTILPLVLDLTNPTPGIGWAGTERMSLAERGPADLVLALALVHHLAISNNVPLPIIASYLARLGRALVIEFVPKSDSQVARLLASREDVFPSYTREGFEEAFGACFRIESTIPVRESDRTLYLMTALTPA
jgi:ribosomal protein L11 methylase PrmA